MNKKRIITIICIIIGVAAVCDVLITHIGGAIKKCQDSKPAKYVFLFIGDGMGWPNVAVANSYLAYKDDSMGEAMLSFSKFPVYGCSWTHSNNARVTDSAAGGTAIAAGEKTKNGHISTREDGSELKSIAYDLHEKGYNVGIMSDVPANHATPAVFYAKVQDRNEYRKITSQIPESGFEFIGGDGLIDYDNIEEGVNAKEYLEARDYAVAFGPSEYKARLEEGKNMVFLQARWRDKTDSEFDADTDKNKDYKVNTDPDKISLGEMLGLCFDKIGKKDPFFIMCEGGNIDWSAHGNRSMEMVRDFENFDSAVKLAYDFYLEHPDETLIIVTADHETGTPSVGYKYKVDWKAFELAEQTGKTLDKEEQKELNKNGVGWVSGSHSGSPVPVFAIGKGAEKFAGAMQNSDIKAKILCEK